MDAAEERRLWARDGAYMIARRRLDARDLRTHDGVRPARDLESLTREVAAELRAAPDDAEALEAIREGVEMALSGFGPRPRA
jgi:hypothetical protein